MVTYSRSQQVRPIPLALILDIRDYVTLEGFNLCFIGRQDLLTVYSFT